MVDPVAETLLRIVFASDEKIGGIVSDAGSNPIDLTLSGTELRFLLRATFDDVAALLTKTIGSGITIGADGSYTVTIPETDKATLVPATYEYTLEYTAPGGDITVVARGDFQVLENAAVQSA